MVSRLPFYLLVTGGRTFNDKRLTSRALTVIRAACRNRDSELVVVHGDATGADSLADAWCRTTRTARVVVPADWVGCGKGAGNLRNQTMINWLPINQCLAFPGNSGTADMVARCEALGIEVIKADKVIWI